MLARRRHNKSRRAGASLRRPIRNRRAEPAFVAACRRRAPVRTRPRMSGALRRPEKIGLAAFIACSACPPAFGDDGDPVVARGDMTDPGQMPVASRVKPLSRPPGGATRTLANSIPGSRTSAAKRQLPSALAGPSSRSSGWPIRRPLARLAERRLRRRAAVGGFLGKLAEGEGPAAVDDEAVGRLAFAGLDVPAVGSRADQHRPRDRRRLAQRLLERAHRGRAGGDRARPSLDFVPRSQPSRRATLPGRQRVGIGIGQRRGLDRDRLPRRAKLVGDDLRQGGPDALAGLDLRHGDRDPPVARDLDESCRTPARRAAPSARCRGGAATAAKATTRPTPAPPPISRVRRSSFNGRIVP